MKAILFYGAVVAGVILFLGTRSVSGFRNPSGKKESEIANSSSPPLEPSPLLEPDVLAFPPGKPAPADLYTPGPYHLLADEFSPPREKESLSCVTSRSCYATDMEAQLSKTGNYRQLTNLYRREFPDHCSAPRQELVLNYYSLSSAGNL